MLETGDDPGAIVEERGLKQTRDTGAIEAVIAEVMAANAGQGRRISRRQGQAVRLLRRPDDEGDGGQGQSGGGQRAAEEGARTRLGPARREAANLLVRPTDEGEAAMARAIYLLFGVVAYLDLLRDLPLSGRLRRQSARRAAHRRSRRAVIGPLHRGRRRSRPDRLVRAPAQRDGAAGLQGGLDADRAGAARAQHLRAVRQPRADRLFLFWRPIPVVGLERRSSLGGLCALGPVRRSAG